MWQHDLVARIDPEDPRLDPVKEAVAALKDAEDTVTQRRTELAKVVAEAIRLGVKPSVLVRETGKSAETVRTWARANGIDPLRDPTGATKAAAERASGGTSKER